jgi:hypothetical protein
MGKGNEAEVHSSDKLVDYWKSKTGANMFIDT